MAVLPDADFRRASAAQRWGRARDRFRSLGVLERSALVLGLLALVVLAFGPLLAPHREAQIVGPALSAPAAGWPLGLDDQGRDIFSRVLFGSRVSMFAALVVIGSGVIIGGLIGLVAGVAGGWIDNALMRVTDVFLALPAPLLALAVVAALGASLINTILAVMIIWWPIYARIVRGEVARVSAQPHVEAARMGGISRVRLIRRHIIPGALAALIVAASLDVGTLLLTLAGLSFLGLGSPPPAAELGSMVSRGLKLLFAAPWIAVYPAIVLSALALLGNLVGDAMSDLLGEG